MPIARNFSYEDVVFFIIIIATPNLSNLGFHSFILSQASGRVNKKIASYQNELATGLLAETEGFEPSVDCYTYGGLANRWFKPLTHVS